MSIVHTLEVAAIAAARAEVAGIAVARAHSGPGGVRLTLTDPARGADAAAAIGLGQLTRFPAGPDAVFEQYAGVVDGVSVTVTVAMAGAA